MNRPQCVLACESVLMLCVAVPEVDRWPMSVCMCVSLPASASVWKSAFVSTSVLSFMTLGVYSRIFGFVFEA